jgi:hypothetical protein
MLFFPRFARKGRVFRRSLRALHSLENASELAAGPVKNAGPSINSALYRPQCNPDPAPAHCKMFKL